MYSRTAHTTLQGQIIEPAHFPEKGKNDFIAKKKFEGGYKVWLDSTVRTLHTTHDQLACAVSYPYCEKATR